MDDFSKRVHDVVAGAINDSAANQATRPAPTGEVIILGGNNVFGDGNIVIAGDTGGPPLAQDPELERQLLRRLCRCIAGEGER